MLHLTFRGVEIREETVRVVRALCRDAPVAPNDPTRFEVLLERPEGRNDVHATVRAISGRGIAEAVAVDPDELLAARAAFARVGERMRTRPAPIYA